MPRVEGYAVVWGLLSRPGLNGHAGVRERFAQGAFDRFLRRCQSVPVLVNHDPRRPLGTADLLADERGLFFVLAGRGLPRGCIGVSPHFVPEAWTLRDGIATVQHADLIEVSLCVRQQPLYDLFSYLRERR